MAKSEETPPALPQTGEDEFYQARIREPGAEKSADEAASASYRLPAAASIRPSLAELREKLAKLENPDKKPAAERWIRASEQAEIAGVSLPSGMVYIASPPRHPAFSREARQVPAWAVDPDLPVQKPDPNKPADLDDPRLLWPRYDRISPVSRYRYLQWLASGRSDPNASMGFVFLYFYGLERRALADARTDRQAQAEIPEIEREVRRLLKLYTGNAAFQRYGYEFLNYLALTGQDANFGKSGEDPRLPKFYEQEPPPVSAAHVWEMPGRLKIALAQLAAEGKPLPARWALSWIAHDHAFSLRTPALRCNETFRSLFAVEYEKRFGAGIRLKKDSDILTAGYGPACPDLYAMKPLRVKGLHNATGSLESQRALQELANDCAGTLDPYSRWLARQRETDATSLSGEIKKLTLLPPFLWPPRPKAAMAQLKKLPGESPRVMTGSELIRILFPALPGAPDPGASELADIRGILAGCGLGTLVSFTPDGKARKREKLRLALFAADNPAGEEAALSRASFALQLSHELYPDTLTGRALAENPALTVFSENLPLLQSFADLLDSERGQQKNLTLGFIRKTLKNFSPEEKSALRALLLAAVKSGKSGPDQIGRIKTLETLYPLLDQSSAAVYGDLFQRSPANPARTVPQGGEPAPARAVALDPEKISRLRQKDPGALLADIFAEGSEPAEYGDRSIPNAPQPQKARADHSKSSPFHNWNLSPSLVLFGEYLLKTPFRLRVDVEAKAAELGLMPDGALESLNDRAFDLFDMPLTEGDDPVEINPDLKGKL